MGSRRNGFSKRLKQMNKRSKKSLLLTVVALIEIIALMGVATYSWVESVSSIMIHTTGQDPTVPGGTKMTINNPLKQKAGVGSSGSAIDLNDYFRKSGDYHLAPASSADGNSMFFPEVRGGNSGNFRVGTINDQNVNYISFTFKLKSTNSNYTSYAFDEAPVIKLDGTAVSNNLVRIGIGVNGNFNIYGNTASNGNETVVNASDGSTGPTVVRAFSDYVKGKNRLFSTTYNTDTFVTVNIWIQDPLFSSYSSYNGKALTIEKFKIVPVRQFTLKAVYMNNGTKTLGASGGTVAINDSSFGATATAYIAASQQVTLKASANTSNGYSFLGYATTQTATTMDIRTKDNCTLSGTVYSYEYTVPSSTSTLYAHFSDEHVLYLKPDYKHYLCPNTGTTGRYAAYIWGNVNGTLVKEWYVMSWDSSTSKYKLTYKGSANSVIFCYMDPNKTYTNTGLNGNDGQDGWNDRWLQTFDLTFPQEFGDYTYRVTSRYITAADGTSLGNDKDNSSHFTTDKVFGYWDQTTPTYLYANVQVSNGTGGSSVSVKLANSTSSNETVTRYYNTTSNTVEMDGARYVDSNNANVKYEAKVELNATAQTAYDFEGWYLNNIRVATTASATVQIPEGSTGTVTYEARFTEKPEDWYVKGDFNSWGESSKLTQSSGNTYTKQIHLDEGNYEFKIYDKKRNTWYSNNTGYYVHPTNPSLPNNTSIPENSNDNQNIKIWVTKGTYTFTWDISQHKLSITASYDTVRIWFDTSMDSGNINGSAKIHFAATGYGKTAMTKSGNNWYIDVPSKYHKGIWFNRCDTNNANTCWNSWNAGDRSIGKYTYKPTAWGSADGSGGNGDWQ